MFMLCINIKKTYIFEGQKSQYTKYEEIQTPTGLLVNALYLPNGSEFTILPEIKGHFVC